jgi:hypothetical protein
MVPIATIRILPLENGWTYCKFYRKNVIKLFWLIASIDRSQSYENKSLAVQFTSLLQLIKNGEYKTMRVENFSEILSTKTYEYCRIIH